MRRVYGRQAAGAAAIAIALSVLSAGPVLSQPAGDETRAAGDSLSATAVAVPRLDVTAELEPRTATVGDRIALRVTLTRPDGVDVAFPNVADIVTPLEVRDVLILPPEARDGIVTETRHYALVAFETGMLKVPGLGFTHVTAAGDTIQAWTDTLFVSIESVLPEGKAPEELEPRDIKPPFELPRRIWPFLVTAAIIAGAVAASWYLRRWWRARKREPMEEPKVEPRVPRRAGQLEQEDMIGRGEVPRFYVAVTEIVRLYVRDRFAVEAIDMTTSELGPSMEAWRIEREEVDWTIDFLTHADLTKFAKYVPEPSRASGDFREAWDFVERTRFRTDEPAGADGSAASAAGSAAGAASDGEAAPGGGPEPRDDAPDGAADADAPGEGSEDTAAPGEDDRAETR